MCIKSKIRNLLLGYRATSEGYIKKLRSMGAEIGEDVILFRPYNTTINIDNAHLVKIGNHVMITGPVTILNHDYSWSVLKRKYGEILGNQKSVILGDNIFVGWGATILAGTKVGDNVIIGANSVVHGKLESNSVYAGNPARRVMSLDEYYKKRKEKQIGEAFEFVVSYKRKYGTFPLVDKMDEYFFLFSSVEEMESTPSFKRQMELMGNYDECVEVMRAYKSPFKSYEEFISYCINKMESDE